jgi:hypothetical protein
MKTKTKRQIQKECTERGLPCSKSVERMSQRIEGDEFINEITDLESSSPYTQNEDMLHSALRNYSCSKLKEVVGNILQ